MQLVYPLCKGSARTQHTVNSRLNKNQKVEKLSPWETLSSCWFQAILMSLRFALCRSHGLRLCGICCLPPQGLLGTCELPVFSWLRHWSSLTVGEQAARDPHATSPWGLSEFQAPSTGMSCMSNCSGGRQPSPLLAPGELLILLWEGQPRIAVCWGSLVQLSSNQHSYLTWFFL